LPGTKCGFSFFRTDIRRITAKRSCGFVLLKVLFNLLFPDLNPYLTLSTSGRKKIWALKEKPIYSKKEATRISPFLQPAVDAV
jgi:hypothetical protein